MKKYGLLLVIGFFAMFGGRAEAKETCTFDLSKAQQDIETREVKTAFGTLTVHHRNYPSGHVGDDQIKLNGRLIYTDKGNMHIYLQNKVFHLNNTEVIPLYEHTGGNFGDCFDLIQIKRDGSVSISKQGLYITISTILEQQKNKLLMKNVYRDSPNKLETWVFDNGKMWRLR
jgi:hypothetical protein